ESDSARRLPGRSFRAQPFKEWFVIFVRRRLTRPEQFASIPIALVMSAGLNFGVSAQATPQTPTPATTPATTSGNPSIVGAWTLNKDLSGPQGTSSQGDDRSGRGGGGYGGGRRGGGGFGGGGRRGGFGGGGFGGGGGGARGGNPDDMRRMRQAMQDIMD